MIKEKEVALTKEGLENLERELETLKTVKRRDVAERIKQAIEFGDISENSEYEDAKNEQAFIEGRILTLEKMRRNAKVIEPDSNHNDENGEACVYLGSTVVISDLEMGQTAEYKIVGAAEANPLKNFISNESPVGAAMLGKKVGDICEIQVPVGIVKYQLLEIR